MTPEQVAQIARQEIAKADNKKTFTATNQGTKHIHNGTDMPFVFQPVITYVGAVGQGISSSTVVVIATGAFSGGETSATLTSNWIYATGIYITDFSNGDQRSVTYTNAATTATWSGALSGAATTDMIVEQVQPITVNLLPTGWTVSYNGTGDYTVTHNLGANSGLPASSVTYPGLYTCVANAIQSTNIYPVSVISNFQNEVDFVWADIATGANADTGFNFSLTIVNNKKLPPPSYYGTFLK